MHKNGDELPVWLIWKHEAWLVQLAIRSLIYNPKSIILHRVSQSLGEHSFQKNKLKLQSQLKLFWKHASGIQLLSISIYWILIHLPYQFIRWLYLREK